MRLGIVRHDAINESDAMTFQFILGAEMIGTKELPHARMAVRVYQDGGQAGPVALGSDGEWWRDYDVLDVPDFIYPWSIWFVKHHPNVWLTVWDNLPWNAPPAHYRFLHERVQGYICRSRQAVNTVRYLVGEEKEIHLVPAAVDTQLFSPAKQPSDEFRVLYVGRLSWEKGIQEMAFATRNLEGVTFCAVGEGAWRKALMEEGIRCPGYVEHHLLPNIYAQASLFLYPSLPTMNWQEQFGISVIEAMASGLPVIISDSGALPDLLPPGTRRDLCIIPTGRWDILRERIQWFRDNPGTAQFLGRLNREWAVKTFSPQVVGRQLEEIYDS